MKGPGEPKKAIVSRSRAGVEALTPGEEVELEAVGASELGTEKRSYPSNRELGESCDETVVAEDPALPGTRLGPATEELSLIKRLTESDGERDGPGVCPVAAELDVGDTENVKAVCFNMTFSFCRRLSISRRFSFSVAWLSVLASNWATLSSS